MKSFYHAYRAYERQVGMGVFSSTSPNASGKQSPIHERFLAGLGDILIRAGSTLKRRWSSQPTMGGSPALGKLNR